MNVELPLDDTMATLICQVVTLQSELIIQRAYVNVLSKLVNPALENQYDILHEKLFHQTFVEQLEKSYPTISDGWRDLILKQIEDA